MGKRSMGHASGLFLTCVAAWLRQAIALSVQDHATLGPGLAACQIGLSVAFTTAAALVNEMMEVRNERRLLRLQKQIAGKSF